MDQYTDAEFADFLQVITPQTPIGITTHQQIQKRLRGERAASPPAPAGYQPFQQLYEATAKLVESHREHDETWGPVRAKNLKDSMRVNWLAQRPSRCADVHYRVENEGGTVREAIDELMAKDKG